MEYSEVNAAVESVDSADNAGNSVGSNTGTRMAENEETVSEPKPGDATQSQNSDGVSGGKESGLIDINKIIIDKTYLGRVAQDADIITLYKEAILSGSSFPAIKLERFTNKLVDGGHTYKALRIIDKMCKKGELKKEDYPNAFTGELVRVEYVDIPEDKLPSFFAMTCNITHGQRPSPKDIEAIATLQFAFNRSYGVKDLARDMQFSETKATEYSKKAREARKAIVEKYIIEASKGGKTQKEIETDLKEKYPTWKGISQASISNTLKEFEAKAETNEAETKTEIELDSNSNEDATAVTDEEKTSEASVKSTPEDSESDSLNGEESTDSSVRENNDFIKCLRALEEIEETIIDRVEFQSSTEVDLILRKIQSLISNIENKARKFKSVK